MAKIQKPCLLTIVILCILLFPASCKSRTTESEEKHSADQPVRGTEAWQWAEISEAEYLSVIVPYLKLPGKERFISQFQNPPRPETELTIRMQYWLNSIHRNLKSAHPRELENVPAPKAIVVRNAEANAFVSPVPVCIDVPVRLNPEIAVTTTNTIDRVNFTTDGEFADDSTTSTDPICIHRKFTPDRLKEMVKWFNAKSDGCNVKFDVDPNTHRQEFIVSKGCPLDPELEDIAIAKSIIVVTTSNWVTINTGLMTQMKDEEWLVIPTLAHELGHYYRSHLTVFPKEYNFFYHLDNVKNAHKPAPEPALKKFGESVYESAKFIARSEVDGQIFDSSLYQPITALIHRYCKKIPKTCSKNSSCHELNTIIEDGTLSDAIGEFPSEDLAEASIPIYKRYEMLASTCASTIKVTNSKDKDSLSLADISLMLRRADLSTLISIPAGKPTLQAVIASLQSQASQLTNTATGTVQNAEKQKLARYTVEMEADEFGLEHFTKLGFDPKDWIEADFVFNRRADDEVVNPVLNESLGIYGGNVDNATCEKIYRDGWKFSGRPFVPDRGGFYDTHPHNCFRTYDVSQEIAAHHYVKQSAVIPPPRGRPWKELAELAERLAPDDTEAAQLENATAMRGTRIKLSKVFQGCPLLEMNPHWTQNPTRR